MKPAGLVQAREGVKVVISGQLATARICERAGERRAVDDGEEFAEERGERPSPTPFATYPRPIRGNDVELLTVFPV